MARTHPARRVRLDAAADLALSVTRVIVAMASAFSGGGRIARLGAVAAGRGGRLCVGGGGQQNTTERNDIYFHSNPFACYR